MFSVDDQFPDSPKMELLEEEDPRVMADAVYLWLIMGCDCRARETDGRFTMRRLERRSMIGEARTKSADAALVRVRLWETVSDLERQMHNWSTWNDTKEQSDRKRRMKNTRQRRYRGRSGSASGDGSGDAPRDGAPDGADDASGDAVEDRTVDASSPRARAGMGRDGSEGVGIVFQCGDVADIFSRERRAAGGSAYGLAFGTTDERLASGVAEWAIATGDPESAVTRSVCRYFEHGADFWKSKGFPFPPWAKDPGSWHERTAEAEEEPIHRPEAER